MCGSWNVIAPWVDTFAFVCVFIIFFLLVSPCLSTPLLDHFSQSDAFTPALLQLSWIIFFPAKDQSLTLFFLSWWIFSAFSLWKFISLLIWEIVGYLGAWFTGYENSSCNYSNQENVFWKETKLRENRSYTWWDLSLIQDASWDNFNYNLEAKKTDKYGRQLATLSLYFSLQPTDLCTFAVPHAPFPS